MRLDRKFFLIAPSFVIVLVTAGLFYTATRLRELVLGSADLARRTAFVDSLATGQKVVPTEHAVTLLQFSIDAEAKRTAAVGAAHDLIMLLAWVLVACSIVLLWTIRGVPRERPPRSLLM